MAVLEAWAERLPVLMTEECNLGLGFSRGAARRLLLEPSAMTQALEAFIQTPALQLRAMGERGRQLVEERYTWQRVAAEMLRVYAWVLGEGERPESILG